MNRNLIQIRVTEIFSMDFFFSNMYIYIHIYIGHFLDILVFCLLDISIRSCPHFPLTKCPGLHSIWLDVLFLASRTLPVGKLVLFMEC